jgi:hypothetical protein
MENSVARDGSNCADAALKDLHRVGLSGDAIVQLK